jgi:hypothetical protein
MCYCLSVLDFGTAGALSRFKIDSATAVTNGIVLPWNSFEGRIYGAQSATNLPGAVWGGMTNLPGIGGNLVFETVNGLENKQEVLKVCMELSSDEIVSP